MQAVPAASDPVAVALADPAVNGRLVRAARAFLGRQVYPFPAGQRAAEAEDIVSTVRVEALRRRKDFDPARGDVVAWLVGFVANVTSDHVRRHTGCPAGPPPTAPGLEDLAADLGRPVVDTVDDQDFVDRLLAQLSPDDRELIRLRYNEDLTFVEIADRRGTSANTLRQRHYRIIRSLQQLCGIGGEVQS